MNSKKLMLILVPVLILVFGYQWISKVDRSNPTQVGAAFAKALKANDTKTAAKFYVPADAEAWRDKMDIMKGGAAERMRERIPADPAFTSPVTAAGVTSITSGDKSYTLEVQQIDGKWYISKAPI